jgi:uncharacterized delta-60 repeat protein
MRCTITSAVTVLGLLLWSPAIEASGGLDTSFGDAGTATVVSTSSGGIHLVAPAPNGMLLGIVGSASLGQQLYRAFPEGTLDSSFGIGGLIDLPNNSAASRFDDWRGIVVDAAGRIVVAGLTPGGDWQVLRLQPNGTADTDFGTSGLAVIDPAPIYSDAPGVTLQPDGKILLAGRAGFDAGMARLNDDGTIDASFGAGGTVVVDYGSGTNYFATPRFQSDGKIVVGVLDPDA